MSDAAPPVIDVHTHFVPHTWPDLGAVAGGDGWPWLRVDSEREATIMVGERAFRRIGASCWDAAERLAAMDADGVDIQIVSPTPVFLAYDRPAHQAVHVARIFNDLALQVCAPARDRLWPFCQVPLQDPDAACAEVDRARAAGHVGVEIGNHVGEADLDSAGVVTFLQHCASIGFPVFVHPWDLPGGVRMGRWMSQWLVGMPAETHLSLLACILGGVFDRVPSSLRVCFAHGGGSFAFWLGRVTNAWHRRRDVVGTSAQPPTAYLGRFFVDSVVFDPPALRLLVEVLGSERVLLGSDYPYPLGESPVGTVIRAADFLTDTERHALLGTNTRRFLGLPSTPDATGAV